jgi:hypothetical protein
VEYAVTDTKGIIMFYLCKNSKIKHDDSTLLTAVEISA